MPNQNNREKNKFFKLVKSATSDSWSFTEEKIHTGLKVAGLGLIALLCVFVFVKVINEVKTYNTIGEVPQSPYMINVVGKGEVKTVKDIAVFTFTSTSKDKTIALAQSKAAELNNKAIAYLKSMGVAEADISTQNYNTYPVYEQKTRPCTKAEIGMVGPEVPTMKTSLPVPCSTSESVISAYETVQVVEVKVRGIDTDAQRSGNIIAGLGDIGVTVSGVTNKVEDPDNFREQARQIAIADARAQAEQIARSLGVRLGKVTSFYEENNNHMRPMYEGIAASADYVKSTSPDLIAGEAKIESSVSITFEIRD